MNKTAQRYQRANNIRNFCSKQKLKKEKKCHKVSRAETIICVINVSFIVKAKFLLFCFKMTWFHQSLVPVTTDRVLRYTNRGDDEEAAEKWIKTSVREISFNQGWKNGALFYIKYRTQSGYRLAFFSLCRCFKLLIFYWIGRNIQTHSCNRYRSWFVYEANEKKTVRSPTRTQIQLPNKKWKKNPFHFTTLFAFSHLQLYHGQQIKS